MNKTLFLALPLFALAACGEEPAPAPAETVAPQPEPTSTLEAADEALFTRVFAETCPAAEPVAVATCQRAMGADTAACRFGLGEDDALRHDATLQVDETGNSWQLADAENICREHDSHHVDN